MGLPRRSAAVLLGAVFVACAVPGPAGAAATPLEYQFTLRAVPVESFAYYTRELVQGVGFTRVQLTQRRREASGLARAVSAALWPITDEEPCLLGCEPPCPESAVLNPTVARTSTPRECNDRVPGAGAAGLPPQLAALLSGDLLPDLVVHTPTDVSASARARLVDPARSIAEAGTTPGVTFAAAGSASNARVTPITGELVALAESFLTDARLPGGQLVTVTSRLEIRASRDRMPEVSYLLSLVGARGSGGRSGVDNVDFTLAGERIPLDELVAEVNAQLRGLGRQLGVLGSLGITVLAPTTDASDVATRFRVTAPVLLVGAEPGFSGPAPTRDGGIRIGSASFEGSYTAPDPPLR